MSNNPKTTLYLKPSVRNALKKRVIDTNQTMSDYVNNVVARSLAEDLDDIESIDRRRSEPTESLDAFLAGLKADGII